MKLSVTQNKIEITEGSLVNQGEYLATPLGFEFTKSYDGLVKYAVFIKKDNGDTYKVPLVEDACDIPFEVLKEKGEFALGVYGFEVDDNDELKLRYSPTPIIVKVDPGSYREEAINAGELTPTDTEIYMQKIQAVLDDLTHKAETGYFDGPKGDPGEPGKDGKDGQDGKDGKDGKDGVDGQAATIAVGTVSTLPAGSNATVENAGSSSEAVFNFGIPQGAKGDPGTNGTDGQDGAAATIAVGTVTTLPAGSSATVENVGSSSAATFNFGIPQGAKGDPGQNGTNGTNGTDGTDGYSPQITLTQDTSTTATLAITYKDATTGTVTTRSATFGGTFVDGNGVSY